MDEQDFTVVCRDRPASRTTAPLALDALARAELGPATSTRLGRRGVTLAPDTSHGRPRHRRRTPFIQVQRALGQFEPEVFRVVLTVDRTSGWASRTSAASP